MREAVLGRFPEAFYDEKVGVMRRVQWGRASRVMYIFCRCIEPLQITAVGSAGQLPGGPAR